MNAKKTLSGLTQEETVQSFIFPVKLTPKQKKEADLQLKEARAKLNEAMTDKDRLTSRLLQLRFRLETYLAAADFDPRFTFSYFLKEYVLVLNKRHKILAEEIDIDETMLSQFMNSRRMPPEYIMIRLELHSENIIPASYWHRLIEKEREHQIMSDITLRLKEKSHVQSAFSMFG